MLNIQNQDLTAEAQRATALQDELDVARSFEEKVVSVLYMLNVSSLNNMSTEKV